MLTRVTSSVLLVVGLGACSPQASINSGWDWKDSPENIEEGATRSTAYEPGSNGTLPAPAGTLPGANSIDPSSEDDAAIAPPVQTSGVYLAMDLENARVRCDYEEETSLLYRVFCRGVIAQPGGDEVLAQAVAPDTTITWNEPSVVSGGITSNTCEVGDNNLTFSCEVTLAGSPPSATLAFSIGLATPTKSRTETVEVKLPYSVGVAAGLITALPYVYQGSEGGTDAEPASQSVSLTDAIPVPQGFQPLVFDLRSETPFDSSTHVAFDSLCAQGNKLYIAVGHNIYVKEGHNLTIYAGTETNGSDDLSHRHRVLLGMENFITCFPGGIYVSDRDNHRVLKMLDTGSVERVLGTGSKGTSPDGRAPLSTKIFDVTTLAVSPSGELYFAEEGTHAIRRIRANRVETVTTVENANGYDDERVIFNDNAWSLRLRPHSAVPAMAFSADGDLYFANNARLFKLTSQLVKVGVAGTGVFGNTAPGTPATDSAFRRIRGVGFDNLQRIILADSVGVYGIDADGVLKTITKQVTFADGETEGNVPDSERFLDVIEKNASEVAIEALQHMIVDPTSGSIHIVEIEVLREVDANGNIIIKNRFKKEHDILNCGEPKNSLRTMLLGVTALSFNNDKLFFGTGSHELMYAHEAGAWHYATRTALLGLDTKGSQTSNLSRHSHCTIEQREAPTIRYDAQLAADSSSLFVTDANRVLEIDTATGNQTVFSDNFRKNANNISDVNLSNPLTLFLMLGSALYFEAPAGDIVKGPDGSLYVSTTLVPITTSIPPGYWGLINLNEYELARSFARGELDFGQYTPDNAGYRIVRIDRATKQVSDMVDKPPYAGTPVEWDQLFRDIRPFIIPHAGLAFDENGLLVFTVPWKNQIFRRNADGSLTTLAGTGDSGFAGDNGNALSARLDFPTRISVANNGDIYFVDLHNNRIRKLRKEGNGGYTITTFFGNERRSDCGTGTVKGEADQQDLEKQIRQSMAVVCQGFPWDIEIDDTCPAETGRTRFFISQHFGLDFNLVEVQRPCETTP